MLVKIILGIVLIAVLGIVWLVVSSRRGCRVPVHKIEQDALLGVWERDDERVTLLSAFQFVYENDGQRQEGDWVYDDVSADFLRIHLPNVFSPTNHLLLMPLICQRQLRLQALAASEIEGELHYRPIGDAKFERIG